MPELTLPGDQVYRDYETDEVPLSGIHRPAKPEIRRWCREMEDYMDDVLAAVAGEGEILGNVRGPADPVTDGHLALWDGTGGRKVKDGGTPFSGYYFDLSGLPETTPGTITGDTVLYVATTGDDVTGDGSEGLPYATLQRAIDHASRFIYLPPADDPEKEWTQVFIMVADGTYVGAEDIGTTIRPFVGGAAVAVYIVANETPGSVVIDGNGGHAVASAAGAVLVGGFKFINAVVGVTAYDGGWVEILGDIIYGADVGVSIYAESRSTIYDYTATTTIDVDGGAGTRHEHWSGLIGGAIFSICTDLTLVGTPDFDVAFVNLDTNATLVALGPALSVTGSATGTRAYVKKLSLLDLLGSDPDDVLPGDSASVIDIATGGFLA